MNYIKQLDSLRAIAVILVIISHWVPKNFKSLHPLGSIGVDIFFVLSGFLITRILLTKKSEIEEFNIKENKITAIAKFMVRRSLRIFPLYYVMLLILYFGVSYLPNPISTDWEYYVLYIQNFLYYARQSYPGGKVFPFWSLAVEEQFYLIWPWILFFINKKHIKNVMIIGILIGTLSSLLFPFIPNKEILSPVLTVCCLQAFCFGGLLSYWSLKGDSLLEYNYGQLKIAAVVSVLFYLSFKIMSPSIIYFDRLFIALITSWIIASILLNKITRFNFVFNSKIMISIGKISYGVYILHNFIPVSVNAMLHLLKKKIIRGSDVWIVVDLFQNNVLIFTLICSFFLWLIASLSFYFFETPFLKLKKYF